MASKALLASFCFVAHLINGLKLHHRHHHRHRDHGQASKHDKYSAWRQTDHVHVSDYQPSKDWSYHFDEEWTFLEEEPELTLADMIANEPGDHYEVVYDLMQRVMGKDVDVRSQFILELIVSEERKESDFPSFLSKEKHSDHPFWSNALNLDVFELDNNGTNGIILRGSSTIALCVAFNFYLEQHLNTTYDWRYIYTQSHKYYRHTYHHRTYNVEIPNALPLPPHQRTVRSVPFSYYENVCTVSYTQAFWTWDEWEPHLDWMALQGINLPLSFFGQEYIFSKTFYKFNFTQSDLQEFFSGPGFFAWQRMGNLRGWGGPITQACIMDQYNLQIQILARMNSFEMIPALTAFAGHVPYAITDYYPDADVTPSPNWFGPKKYCCDQLLNFTDPLFTEIGMAFIEEQTKYFGTGHVYQADSFNEMNPPTDAPSYLNAASKYVYDSMANVDENAVWLMQGWAFQYHQYWTQAHVAAYVGGVPDDAMIILDLYDEVSPQYQNFDSFYGTPFIWNTLHNFGGNDGMLGTLYNIAVGLPKAKKYPNSSVIGVGITMEGIWQNYIVYDETLKMAFSENDLDLDAYVDKYALRRYGLPHSLDEGNNEKVKVVVDSMQKAWQQLKSTVYNISFWGGVTKSIMCVQPSLKAVQAGFQPTQLMYEPVIIQEVWQMYMNVTDTKIVNVAQYRYDLVDISRQALSDLFYTNYVAMIAAYDAKNVDRFEKYSDILMDLMTDFDNLLNTDKHWMLGEWIEMARKHSTNVTEQDWWEFNARNQVTLWGPNGEISDYASKTWGGLIGTYHQPQWQLFVSEVAQALKQNKDWDQNAFNTKNMNTIQQPWQTATDKFPVKPQNDTIVVACDLYQKWNTLKDETTCASVLARFAMEK